MVFPVVSATERFHCITLVLTGQRFECYCFELTQCILYVWTFGVFVCSYICINLLCTSASCMWCCVFTFLTAVTYLQGLAYVSEDVSFTCNFAFGIDFDSLLCSITIDGGPAVYVDVTAGSPPSATYTAAGLEEGSHTVRAQAVRRSDRLPIESFNISKPFTILADDQDGKLNCPDTNTYIRMHIPAYNMHS